MTPPPPPKKTHFLICVSVKDVANQNVSHSFISILSNLAIIKRSDFKFDFLCKTHHYFLQNFPHAYRFIADLNPKWYKTLAPLELWLQRSGSHLLSRCLIIATFNLALKAFRHELGQESLVYLKETTENHSNTSTFPFSLIYFLCPHHYFFLLYTLKIIV